MAVAEAGADAGGQATVAKAAAMEASAMVTSNEATPDKRDAMGRPWPRQQCGQIPGSSSRACIPTAGCEVARLPQVCMM